MKLKSLRIERPPFYAQEVELSPLTILFGPNGAGKSTILASIEDALGLLSPRKFEGFHRTVSSGSIVYATLDERYIPGSSDETIMRNVLWLDLEEIDDSVFSHGDRFRNCPPLAELIARKETQMIESGTQGTPEQRSRIAKFLLRHSVLAFGALGESEGNWGLVCSTSLSQLDFDSTVFDTSRLDRGYGDVDDEMDSVLLALDHLERGEDAVVTMLWGELSKKLPESGFLPYSTAPKDTLYRRVRPRPMRLDFELDTLNVELEDYIDRLASRLTLSSLDATPVPWLTAIQRPHIEDIGILKLFSVKKDDTFKSDSPTVDESFGDPMGVNPREREVFIVSPLIQSAVERIKLHANLIAPEFLVTESQIDIKIVSPVEWVGKGSRISISMKQGKNQIPLTSAGSGIARWASYSIRLACEDLLNGELITNPNDDADLTLNHVTYDGFTPYETIAALEIAPVDLDVVLLLDEPEAYLHPRAVTSVGEWLLDISPRLTSTVVATHHPSLFNLQGLGLRKIVVSRSEESSKCEIWDPASERLVNDLAHQIGLSPADIFMMGQFVLFVEGPHDLAILEEFFGEWMKSSMVRILPLHGAHNISLLATSDIVWQMGVPIGVLTDETNVDRIMKGDHANHVEKLVERMLRECTEEGREVAVFGLERSDILFYLDDQVTASFATTIFPGWNQAREIWSQIVQSPNDTANGTKFKKWITNTYGISLERDSVREMAKKCHESGAVPDELLSVVAEVIAKAQMK